MPLWQIQLASVLSSKHCKKSSRWGGSSKILIQKALGQHFREWTKATCSAGPFCLLPKDFRAVAAQEWMPLEWVRIFRSAPKGRQQMGETGFCKNLRKSCENLRFPAVCCANLRLPNPLIYRASAENQRKSAKICENVRSGSGFSLLLSPFWRTLNFFRSCTHRQKLSWTKTSNAKVASGSGGVWHCPKLTDN